MAYRTAAVDVTAKRRVIALEIRASRFGVVIIEGATLLDWGVRRCKCKNETASATADRKLSRLLDLYQPAIMLIREIPPRKSSGGKRAAARLLKRARAAADKRQIAVSTVSSETIKAFFAGHGCTTKDAVASILAEWFRELAPRLPPKRKFYDPEHHNTPMFDAAAAAMAFLAGN